MLKFCCTKMSTWDITIKVYFVRIPIYENHLPMSLYVYFYSKKQESFMHRMEFTFSVRLKGTLMQI